MDDLWRLPNGIGAVNELLLVGRFSHRRAPEMQHGGIKAARTVMGIKRDNPILTRVIATEPIAQRLTARSYEQVRSLLEGNGVLPNLVGAMRVDLGPGSKLPAPILPASPMHSGGM